MKGGYGIKIAAISTHNAASFHVYSEVELLSLAFANGTTQLFQYLAAYDKSHRLTLLKHEIALDHNLAKAGGL